MRVLFINDNHEHVGGAETYLFSIIYNLENKGIEVYFFSVGLNKTCENKCLKIYQEVKENRLIDYFHRNYFNQHFYSELRKWIRKVRPDVIHLNNIARYQNSIVLAAIRENIPLMQTVHDIRAICPTGTGIKRNGKICNNEFGLKCLSNKCLRFRSFIYLVFPWKIKQLLNRQAICCYVVVSNTFKEIFKFNGFSNVIFIPFFIDNQKYQYNKNKKNKNNLLYVGSLIDIKGLKYLIKSMPVVLEKFPEARLHIVGEGSSRKEYERVVKNLGIGKNIIFHGKAPNNKVHEFYQNANIVLVPSVCIDQYPLVGLEAMASGVPVIGSNIGGIPEWLEDGRTGLLVEPGNTEQISSSLIKILSNENLMKTMAENARKRAENWPNHEDYADKLIEIYNNIIR